MAQISKHRRPPYLKWFWWIVFILNIYLTDHKTIFTLHISDLFLGSGSRTGGGVRVPVAKVRVNEANVCEQSEPSVVDGGGGLLGQPSLYSFDYRYIEWYQNKTFPTIIKIELIRWCSVLKDVHTTFKTTLQHFAASQRARSPGAP